MIANLIPSVKTTEYIVCRVIFITLYYFRQEYDRRYILFDPSKPFTFIHAKTRQSNRTDKLFLI